MVFDEYCLFSEPLIYAKEPSLVTLVIQRQGKIDHGSTVYYRTLDGSASVLDGDYKDSEVQKLIFDPGERQKKITVSVWDDSIPEGNETFSVQLFDVSGELTC